MQLATLLSAWIAEPDRIKIQDCAVTGLQLDSRKLLPGNLFLAVPGTRQHGLAHARQALANGAVAVAYDPVGWHEPPPAQIDGMALLPIAGLAEKAGDIAARFYGNPSQDMVVIGITGTNGKTSCSHYLAQLLEGCGVIGTLGWGMPGRLAPTLNTTPDAVSVQAMLAAMKAQGLRSVAMEASSHGLDQGRVNGIQFQGAVFTNISRDHLDYHADMNAYVQAKLQLLAGSGLAFTVVNLDDAYGATVRNAAPHGVAIWGVSRTGVCNAGGETIHAKLLRHLPEGLELAIAWRQQKQVVTLPLYGDFNSDNALLVLAVLLALGGDFTESVRKLSHLTAVPGRMQRFGGGSQPLVFVDYAHSPDAMEKVLASVRRHCQGQLWVVFGCGGERDVGKRPLMRQAAESLADRVVVTDDNPRCENSMAIINQIMAGGHASKVQVIADRQEAIADVIARAETDDCVVIAGKGHEDYQEINGEKIPFRDQWVVADALTKRT